jgi:hypothetical protein
LIQEHLAWLDREIAAESGSIEPIRHATPIEIAAQPVAPPIVGESQTFSASSPAIEQQAETAMAQYSVTPQAIQQDVRKGCLLYFAVGFLLFAATVVGVYLAWKHGRAT